MTQSRNSQPQFLTAQQRSAHTEAFLRGETNFAFPFEPWVIDSWTTASKENGWDVVADRMRTNLLARCKIANDPTLTKEQKIKKLRGFGSQKPKS